MPSLSQISSNLLILIFGLIVSSISLSISANNITTKKITFNEYELAYLKNNPILKVNVDNAWFPFNFVENGQIKGYSNEMIQLVADKVGLSVQFVTGHQREDYLNMLETGEIDLISNMKVTPEREKSLIFTQYNPLKVINGLLTLSGHEAYIDFNLLKSKNVAVVRGFFYEELMRSHYPEINLILTDSTELSIEQLMLGHADAVLDSYAALEYYTQHYFVGGVKNTPLIDDPVFNYLPHYMGLTQKNRMLRSILNKGLLALSKEQLTKLHMDWSYATDPGNHFIKKSFQESMPIFRVHEIRYLQKKGKLHMCVDPSWLPIEGLENGKYIGMGGDFVRLFSQRIANPIKLVKTDSWSQTLSFAKQGKCDFIPIITKTEERQEYLLFSFPYLRFPLVLTIKDRQQAKKIENVIDKPLGIVKDYAYKKYFDKKYPQSKLIEFNSLDEGLNAVENGEIYGFIDSLPVISRKIKQNYPTLKISDKFESKYSLSLAVTKSNPILLGIFNKVIASISEEQHNKIVDRWMPLLYEKEAELKWFWVFIISLSLAFIFLISRYSALIKINRSLIKEQKKLERLAMRDCLTGLPNHYNFKEILDKEWLIAENSKKPLSVILFEIDHFKHFNDQYGRLAGDRCLIELTTRLKSILTRPEDLLARYDGEEFALILPEIDKEQVKLVVDDIFYVLKQWTLPHRGLVTESVVTISVGAATLVFDEKYKADELIRRADCALYGAQEKGSSQFLFYGDS